LHKHTFTCFISSLFLPFILPEASFDQGFEACVLDRLLALESRQIYRDISSENRRAAGLDCHSGVEVGNELTSLLSEHEVGHQQIVIRAFALTNLSRSLVLERSEREWECRESLANFRVERAGALQLEVVYLLKLALVDGGTEISLLGLTFAGGHIDVESDHITWGKLKFFDLLSRSFFVDDSIVSVDQVLLYFVRKHALNWLNTKLSADFCNDSGHFSVSGSLLNGPLGGLHSVVSG
jgi:hypothetical protein